MTCAKQTVTCTLVFPDGRRYVGTNACRNPQAACPREPGEGYTKCLTVCAQPYHAEVAAIVASGNRAAGSHAYLEGHTHACQACQKALIKAGIQHLTIGPPPQEAGNGKPETGVLEGRTGPL